jgi:hypothetical protein
MTPTREPTTLSRRSSEAFRAYLKILLAFCYVLIPAMLVLGVSSGDWAITLVGEVAALVGSFRSARRSAKYVDRTCKADGRARCDASEPSAPPRSPPHFGPQLYDPSLARCTPMLSTVSLC